MENRIKYEINCDERDLTACVETACIFIHMDAARADFGLPGDTECFKTIGKRSVDIDRSERGVIKLTVQKIETAVASSPAP